MFRGDVALEDVATAIYGILFGWNIKQFIWICGREGEEEEKRVEGMEKMEKYEKEEEKKGKDG